LVGERGLRLWGRGLKKNWKRTLSRKHGGPKFPLVAKGAKVGVERGGVGVRTDQEELNGRESAKSFKRDRKNRGQRWQARAQDGCVVASGGVATQKGQGGYGGEEFVEKGIEVDNRGGAGGGGGGEWV